MARTASRRTCEPRPLAQDGQIRPAPPVGAVNLGPGRRIVLQDSPHGVSRLGSQAGTQAPDPTPVSAQNRKPGRKHYPQSPCRIFASDSWIACARCRRQTSQLWADPPRCNGHLGIGSRRLSALPPVRPSRHRVARAAAAAGIIGADRRERTEADLRATGETGGKPYPRLSPSSPRRTADRPSRAAQPSLSPRMFGCRAAPGAHRAGDRVTHRTGTRWYEREPVTGDAPGAHEQLTRLAAHRSGRLAPAGLPRRTGTR